MMSSLAMVKVVVAWFEGVDAFLSCLDDDVERRNRQSFQLTTLLHARTVRTAADCDYVHPLLHEL